jgi:putative peptidoglycan lipid II flippase
MALPPLTHTATYRKAMLFSVAFNAGAKLALFFLSILIAQSFGSNIKTDIYFFIYGGTVLLSGFINAFDVMVLVPESMRIRATEGDPAAMAFLNYFLRMYVLAGLAVAVIFCCFGTSLLGWVSKFSGEDIIAYRDYFLIGSFYFLLQVLCNYVGNILTSLRHFTAPLITSGINTGLVIAGIFLFQSKWDVLSVLVAGLVAYAVQLFIGFALLRKLGNWRFLRAKKPAHTITWKKMGIAGIGQLATFAGSYWPLYLLSGFGGMISSLGYGKNIADVPNTLLTAQLSNVSGIQLNEQAAAGDRWAMNESFMRTAKLLVYIMVPAGFFISLFATPVVQLVYQRGQFTAADVEPAAVFLRLLSLTIFVIAINSMVTRVLIALQALKQGLIYQLAMNGLLILSTWLCVRQYGAYGYGYALIAVNLLNLAFMYFVCAKAAPGIAYGKLAIYTFKIGLVNAGIGIAMWYLHPYITVVPLLKLVLCGLIWGSLLVPFLKFLPVGPILKNNFIKPGKDAA